MAISKRVLERFGATIRPFQTILEQQRAKDVSEADTVTIVKDVLAEMFGYDKYAELTSEHSIRGTYCDLAVKVDGTLALLIEVKAIGLELRDSHVKQVVDYAANQGCEWVVLTNAIEWRLFQVMFKKPIDKQEVTSFNLLSVNVRNQSDTERLFLLTREGFTKSALAAYRDKKDATSRYILAAVILHSDSVMAAIRREVRRVSDLLVDPEVIDKMLRDEVLKREAIEGEHAETAVRRVTRSTEKSIRQSSQRDASANPDPGSNAPSNAAKE